MSYYAEYRHGLISKDELVAAFNMDERPYIDDEYDVEKEIEDDDDEDNEDDNRQHISED